MNIIIAIIILLGYTITLCVKGGGVPSSLSASVFNLPYDKRWIWTVVLYGVVILAMSTYMDKVSQNTQFLAFISMAGLAFVGAAPLVKDHQELAYKVHCWAAVICAVCSQLVLVFNQPWLLLCWVPWVVALLWISKYGRWYTITFWGEMVCFGSTFAYCLI